MALIASLSLSLLACGGAVAKLGTGDDGGSGDDGAPGDGGATDADSGPQCPAPSAVYGGGACFAPTLSCPSDSVVSNCGGSPTSASCTCENGSWQCPVGGGGGCSATCPPPASVAQGAACPEAVFEGIQCQSSQQFYNCNGVPVGYVYCACNGQGWNCETPGVPYCPVDAAPPCPPQDSTLAGQACSIPEELCPGDPTDCGGYVDYDELQCSAGVWVTVAATACDIDAGVVDAPEGDGGI